MFEKEAEEIANKRCHEIMCYGHCSFSSPKHHRCGKWHREYECALKGAEFGYNKANEWHDLRKNPNDLPKDKKDMLMSEQLILLIKMKGTDNLSISIGQYNFSMQEFSYPHIVGLTDVVAWKEIVLPELPKDVEE